MEPSTSPKYSLNTTDVLKALRGLLVVLVGAALTYLLEAVGQFDFGQLTPVVVSVASTLVEIGRRWLTDYARS